MFGRLTLDAFKHDAIEYGAGVMMVLSLLAVIGLLTYLKKWKWIWEEWLTSLDPKRIGVMYVIVSFIMLFKGVTDAIMMRVQQMFAAGDVAGYLTAPHFQQIFTAHGTTMIFFVGMGVIFAIMNLILPLQIGARDVAFPFLNSLGFWFFTAGGSLMLISLIIGNFSGAGWVSYPPLSGIQYSPDVGVDYWIWSVQIAGVGSLFSGINFLVTIFTMRCPGMTFMKLPLLIWSILGSLVLIIFAFPILTATVGMLTLDRLLDMKFFTSDFGGNPMMYINLIWAWGHPEVYILILPAFGIFSEVVATYSSKRLFGYVSMVGSIIAITFLSFIVWLHHFFTMGAGASVNAFFGIMTMFIAIPTGVKVFNWIFTEFRGRVRFDSPMLWFMGFVIVFVTGGMTGMLLSIAPVDFQVHNSLFLIAHFHSMVIGGVLFGFFAGFTYWFPKFTGFKLNEKLGKLAAYLWIGGFLVAFMPLYILGLMGATRRLDHYDSSTGWQPLFIIAGIGGFIVSCGIAVQMWQLWVSFRDRKQNKDTTGDPWDGRTLEWSTTSPPPIYNFARIPVVHDIDAFWDRKNGKFPEQKKPYKPIHMPKSSSTGFIVGWLSFIVGFAATWHILWLGIAAVIGIFISLIVHLAEKEPEFEISVAEIETIEGHV